MEYNMKVVIPMSGSGQRFVDAGYKDVKPLIKVDGIPIIQHVTSLFPDSEFIFICSSVHLEQTPMKSVLESIAPGSTIISIEPHKKGPVYTVLAAAEHIPDHETIVVSYCDYGTLWNFHNFLENIGDAEGGVAAYIGFHPHMLGADHYAYMLHENMNMTSIREKTPFGPDKMAEYASNGTYYAKSGRLLKQYCRKLVESGETVNGEYYMSMIYQKMVDDGLRVRISEIEKMLQWGTPRDLEEYSMWAGLFMCPPLEPLPLENTLLVLPMAGKGSRFSEKGYTVPKPFIEIDGISMVKRAIECLPRCERTILIKLTEHQAPDYEFVSIDEVTDGQATTCSLVIKDIDPNKSVLISACDNGAYYNTEKFDRYVKDQRNDIIVWAFDNHPTLRNTPRMYGWLKVDSEGFVTDTAIKKDPDGHSCAIVGTMFFRKSDTFMKGYRYIKENNITTNGEYYVDDLLAPLVGMGYKVKVFLVDYYMGWGTPNDYMTYMYWKEYFSPKLVIYDMDDTLVTYSRSNAKAMKGVLADIPGEVFAEAKKEIYTEFPESFVKHDKLVQIKRALSKLGRPNTALKIYLKYEADYLADIDLLRRPNTKFKNVIMSNNNLRLQLSVAEKLGIQVEEIFTANEFVKEKSDPKSLAYIAAKYGVSPREVLVVGDSINDALWAHKGGARAVII